MRKMLNTLYVTTPEAYVSRDGDNVVVSVDKEERLRVPIINLEGIVTFGYMGASPGVMKLCVDHGVALSFLTPSGRFIASLSGPTRGNVLLRREQYRVAGAPESALHLARIMTAAKIKNGRSILQRYVRDYGPDPDVDASIRGMAASKRHALTASGIAELIGFEGEAANAYFGVFDHLIVQQKDSFIFDGRNRRPPRDPVNAMLSFAYALLASDVSAALETVGLDPCVGFLHTMRPGRKSLALDLMEELRAYIADRFVLSLINRRQIDGRGFAAQDDSVTMTDLARKAFIKAWQLRKQDQVTHPFMGEKIPIGLLPYAQAMLLARHLRGDLDDYPAFCC